MQGPTDNANKFVGNAMCAKHLVQVAKKQIAHCGQKCLFFKLNLISR